MNKRLSGARLRRLALPLVLVAAPVVSMAEEAPVALPEVTVKGESDRNGKGQVSTAVEALPTPVSVLNREEIETQAVRNFIDLLRDTPGVIPRGLGQGDIGEGFVVRGFQAGHGSVGALVVDGVPLNWQNSLAAHGLTDPYWVQPEFIERVEVIKGPFSALYGNFALGAVVNVVTKIEDSAPSAGFEVGSYDAYRALGTYSSNGHAGVTPFVFGDVYGREGYRDNSSLERYNLFAKFTVPVGAGRLSIRANGVRRNFEAPGTIEVERLRAGLERRSDSIFNDTDGGSSEYYGLVANYVPNGEAGLNASVYAGNDEFNRYASFARPFTQAEINAARANGTSDNLATDIRFRLPVDDQRLDTATRFYTGAKIYYNWTFGKDAAVFIGTDLQYDDGDSSRSVTVSRAPASTLISYDSRVLGAAVFGQGQLRLFDRVKAVVGFRFDTFDIEVDNLVNPALSGKRYTDIFSPKFGLIYNPLPWIDLFANRGTGFRTPSANELITRSGTNTGTGLQSLDVLELTTVDVGVSARPLPGLDLNLSFFTTETEGEIRQITVNGRTEFVNEGDTRRDGVEVSGEYRFSRNLSVKAAYTSVDAKLTRDVFGNPAPASADSVTGVPDSSYSGGITWRQDLPAGFNGVVDAYIQQQAPFPLNVAGTAKSASLRQFGIKGRLSRGAISGFLQLSYVIDDYASESYSITGGREQFAPPARAELLGGLRYTFF